MGNEFGSQVTLALAVSFVLQWLKKQTWFPWLSFETEKVNRLVSVFISIVAGFGVYFVFDHATGVLTISGLTLANLMHALSHAGEQFMLQHAAYRTVIAPPLPGITQAIVREQTEEKKL